MDLRWLILAAILGVVAPGEVRAQADPRQLLAVHSAVSAVAEALPPPRPSLFPKVAVSGQYAARVVGNDVTVTTRFLREASREALGAAIARGLAEDPVLLAVTLHRAGFDGPGGLAELHDRLARLAAWEAWQRAEVERAYGNMVAVTASLSFNVASRPGYHLMYRALIDQATARYQRAASAHRTMLAGMRDAYAMEPVTAELVHAVREITAILHGVLDPERSPWGPRTRPLLEGVRPPPPD